MSPEKCPTNACTREAVVPGFFRFSEDDAGSQTAYCRSCATELWVDGHFHPDRISDLQDAAPELSENEAATLARFEAAPPEPESFDAHAAVRRVMKLADEFDQSDSYKIIGRLIREAVEGVTA